MANKTVYPFGTDGQLPSNIGIVNDLTTGGINKALSAEMGKEIGLDLGLSLQPFESIQHAPASTAPSTSGTRYSLLFNVEVGMRIKAQSSWGAGIFAAIYATRDIALMGAASTILQGFPDGDYSTAEHSGEVQVAGVLRIGAKKDTAFTETDIADFLSSLTFDITRGGNIKEQFEDVYNEVGGIKNGITPLFLGNLVQKAMTATGLSDSVYRVSTKDAMVVPRMGATLKFKLPHQYYIGIRNGAKAENLSYNDYWYGNDTPNGLTFTFHADSRYFRLCFAHTTDYTSSSAIEITPQEVLGLIASGEISITYKADKQNVVGRNIEAEKYVKAVMRNYDPSNINKNASLFKLPLFLHTSDVHSDAQRFQNFMDYADYIGVDAALATGDMAGYSAEYNGMDYMDYIADTHTTPLYPILGNHDARNKLTAEAQNALIQAQMTRNEVVTPVGDTYPTYYYKDLTAKKIRLIGLNLYEGNRSGDKCNFTQTQCEWMIATLKSTPADYGILLMMHSPETIPTLPTGSPYTTFKQPVSIGLDVLIHSGSAYALYGRPFYKIIDAFIGRTSTSVTYTTNGTSVTVTADFTSGVNSGVEFIAYVNGHFHTDNIGYITDAEHLQLNLNVNCGVSIYGATDVWLANNSDLPRDAWGSTQDCFNLYAIDRGAKVVRVAKVGSNMTANLTERKYMVIPYAD